LPSAERLLLIACVSLSRSPCSHARTHAAAVRCAAVQNRLLLAPPVGHLSAHERHCVGACSGWVGGRNGFVRLPVPRTCRPAPSPRDLPCAALPGPGSPQRYGCNAAEHVQLGVACCCKEVWHVAARQSIRFRACEFQPKGHCGYVSHACGVRQTCWPVSADSPVTYLKDYYCCNAATRRCNAAARRRPLQGARRTAAPSVVRPSAACCNTAQRRVRQPGVHGDDPMRPRRVLVRLGAPNRAGLRAGRHGEHRRLERVWRNKARGRRGGITNGRSVAAA
jgi:hypothetical protein